MDGDVVAFLRARLDEDEALLSVPMAKRMIGRKIVEVPITRLPAYMERDRDRWRREVEAKRAILNTYADWTGKYADPCRPVIDDVIGLLAAIYSDHLDYNPEWSPS